MSTQQSAEFRQRVEAAAYALLATVGYHNASMQAIAERAEVPPRPFIGFMAASKSHPFTHRGQRH